MKSVKELKNIFQQESQQGDRQVLQNNYYPFWDMKPGQKAVVRFLADKDSDNPRGFLYEKVSHNLTINGQRKTVPCLGMYGEDCPICKASQEFYKKNDEVNGKRLWKKKQYLAQAIIVEDPLPPDNTTGEKHEGNVRLLSLGFQIYNIIKEAFTSDELEDNPYSHENGCDFIIKKTEQGQYASYAVGTKFSKQRALSDGEIAAAEEGSIELSTLLPKHPDANKVQAMLDADLNGEAYSDGSDGGFETTPSVKKTPPATKAPPVTKQAPAANAGDAEDGDVDDMLAAIRARRSANK